MSPEDAERVSAGVAAINETYRTGDTGPWRRHVEAEFAPDVVLEASTNAFTEGEWHGHEGAVGFVANQMEVLDGMWLRLDDLISLDGDHIVATISFGGRARLSDLDVEMHPTHVFTMRDGSSRAGR